MTTLQQVQLGDDTFWFVADVGERDGPLCESPDDYRHGRLSYAHVMPGGNIDRLQETIGTYNDLVFTGVCEKVEPSDDAFGNMMEWGSFDMMLRGFLASDNV